MEKVTVRTSSKTSAVFKKIFLRYLERFSQGHLVLNLPSGESFTAGDSASSPKGDREPQR